LVTEKGDSTLTQAWHHLKQEEIFEELQTHSEGLNEQEAKDRLEKHGPNELDIKTKSPFVRFLRQFHNPLLYILMIAAVVAYFLDKTLDMWVILAVVLATAIIGFVQEGKAESAISSLSQMLAPECTVLRDGSRKTIESRYLVPGDIVLLESGDRIPADLRLFQGNNLALDESAITGESVPAKKQFSNLQDKDVPLAERDNMAYSGTIVARGAARAVVVATGTDTEVGRISEIMSGPGKMEPPIMRKIKQFTRVIIIGIFILGTINLFLGLRFGYEIEFLFLVSVGMIVAMVPEGLPASMVAAFSYGVTKMADSGALIRKLPAVETLGTTTVICSDKTGTLTKNEMTVQEIYTGGQTYHVSGSGYSTEGEFSVNNEEKVEPTEENGLYPLLLAGYLCNNAGFEEADDGQKKVSGDPTEGALLVTAAKAGVNPNKERLDEIPFESDQKYMATLSKVNNNHIIFVKGAPEQIVALCTNELFDGEIKELDREKVLETANQMADNALRVLGFAQKTVSSDKTNITNDDLTEMTFLGLQGMMDPPREETADAVKQCRNAGIRIIMITGDHARTASAIAAKLSIGEEGEQAVTGEELEKMSDDELYDLVASASVYARTSPEHKYRIVRQLQKRGEIVAVTGDGVNDAPALSIADIGIAMGRTGTQAAKDASDLVLTDDNFATIVRAIEEGRHTFNNIWKVILFLLPANGGEGMSILAAILLSPLLPVFSQRLPVEPIHILWINLIASITCAIPLTREPMEEGLLNRPPREPGERLFNPVFIRKVSIVSLASAGSAIIMFLLYYNGMLSATGDNVFAEAQTVAFTTIIMVEVFYLFTSRWIKDSAFAHSPFTNRLLVLGAGITVFLQVIIVYAEPLFGFSPLRTQPFPLHVWPLIILVSLSGFLLIELEKAFSRRADNIK
jgi:magnesium-transporting ATPase (P-type)